MLIVWLVDCIMQTVLKKRAIINCWRWATSYHPL